MPTSLHRGTTELNDDEVLAQLRVDEVQIRSDGAARMAPKQSRRTRKFTKFPWIWEEELRRAKRISTYRVALFVLRRWWQGGSQPVPVSNVALPDVSRYQKSKSLAELEALGLVRIERHPWKSPLVTPLKLG